jgi:hypothetical protein
MMLGCHSFGHELVFMYRDLSVQAMAATALMVAYIHTSASCLHSLQPARLDLQHIEGAPFFPLKTLCARRALATHCSGG